MPSPTEPAKKTKQTDTFEVFEDVFNVQEMRQYVEKLGIIEWLGGSEEERTKERNTTALQRLLIRPRALVQPVGKRDLTTSLLNGRMTVSMPICFSPSAFQMYAHPEGEIATAKGCASVGALMILSAWTNKPLEQVKEESKCENMWMNVYIFKHRELITQLVRKAESAGYKAIVVSVDIPTLSRRKGTSFYKQIGKFIGAAHFSEEDPRFRASAAGDPDATWNDFADICRMTSLPVICKGIMNANDARQALKHGASAVFVSNHGGRQLDGAPSTIEVLPEVVREVGGSCDVYVDGGFLSGMDVFKGLALGATAVFLGRPAFYGLAYNGSLGVRKVLEIMSDQLSRTMALSGCAKLSDIKPELVMTASFI